MDFKERIGLNFIRPDLNRPGNYDFVNSGIWLTEQYRQIGLTWDRLAFSWLLIQPEKDRYDWMVYDRLIDAACSSGIKILATVGGHFDIPAVPAWAGESLKQVVEDNPDYLWKFIRACVERYNGRIKHWEILNEPYQHHSGLTVADYVDRILKPSYEIIKEINKSITVLPCAYSHLPVLGDKSYFWENATGFFDIFNLHIYTHWGYLRYETTAAPEVAAVSEFRKLAHARGEEEKPIWVTETGWFGTAGICHGFYGFYNMIPDYGDMVDYRHRIKPYYTGKEIVEHEVTAREDLLRSLWMKEMFEGMLSVPGCEKVFLWSSMDEFEGGYEEDALYGRGQSEVKIRNIDMWGVISGDRKWRKSAHVLQEMLRSV